MFKRLRSPESALSRLAAFTFTLTRDGEVRLLTRYAADKHRALALAPHWAAECGFVVEADA